jgi:large subunit ribosomal protein L18
MVRKLNPTERRAQRNRSRLKKLAGEGRLRLSVFRSSKHISAQMIDD